MDLWKKHVIGAKFTSAADARLKSQQRQTDVTSKFYGANTQQSCCKNQKGSVWSADSALKQHNEADVAVSSLSQKAFKETQSENMCLLSDF